MKKGNQYKRQSQCSYVTNNGVLLNCTASTAMPFKPVLTNETNLPRTPRSTTTSRPSRTPRKSLNGCSPNSPKQAKLDTFELLGLPKNVIDVYRDTRKIKSLYEWQENCLQDVRLLQGSNFILSLPTGAGKTLVAELLMLRCNLFLQKSSILILPFIAIVSEKVVSLSPFEDSLDICIEEYASTRGKIPPLKRPTYSTYVCTIEKANILVNSMISEGRIDDIGLVIVDEMHLLADPRRGFILEQCLSKLILTNPKAQIIGLSATLSSIDKVKTFLNANVFSTEFRPVNLTENIKVGDDIYRYNKETGQFEYDKKIKRIVDKSKDPDNLIPLIAEIVPKRSVLIFCASKQNTENLCQKLASLMPKDIKDFQSKAKEMVIQQIMESNDGIICPIMKCGLKAGVCYHHSGLTRDERILVEASFRNGVISIICATSTLATGVNLPARRIIIRSTRIGIDQLGKTQYLQMIGRAGRAGLDTEGDCYTFVDNERSFFEMRNNELPEIISGMNTIETLESFLLDLLALKICKNEHDLQNALKFTMYNPETASQLVTVKQAVNSLISKQLLTNKLEITELGLASSKANLSPTHSVLLYKSLLNTLDQGLVLSSRFHLLCIIVPYDIELISYDFNTFYDEYQKFSKGEKDMLAKWDVTEAKIVDSMSISRKLKCDDPLHRIYIALILKNLWSIESKIEVVSEKYGLSRGFINSMLQSVCTYANQISRFCEQIPQFFAYQKLFPDLIQQLRLSSQKELAQFLALDCIKVSRAQSLFNSGYRNIGDIAKSTPDELIKSIHLLNQFQAERIISSAKILLRDLVAEKADELKQMGAESQDIKKNSRPTLDETRGNVDNTTPMAKRRRASLFNH